MEISSKRRTSTSQSAAIHMAVPTFGSGVYRISERFVWNGVVKDVKEMVSALLSFPRTRYWNHDTSIVAARALRFDSTQNLLLCRYHAVMLARG